jgi:hypothetical protein|tara:strand:- start:2039 stop:2248 length:210 start_codon:yes stop_codon:yes gene_type:complete
MAEKVPFKTRITPKFIRPYVKIWREEGFSAFLKKAGWKVVLGVVVFYLLRDSIIYLVLPYLVAKGIFQF